MSDVADSPPASEEGEGRARRQERHRRALLSLLGSNGQKVVRILVAIFFTPLALGYFGREVYGLWVATAVVLSYSSALMSSVGYAVMTQVANARGRDSIAEITEIFTSTTVGLALVAGVLGAVGSILAAVVPLTGIFGIPVEMEPQARAVLLVVLWTGVFGVVLGQSVFLQQAYQEDYFGSLWATLGTVLNLGALAAIVWVRGDLVHLAIASGVLLNLIHLLTGLHHWTAHPECRLVLGAFRPQRVLALAASGGLFFLTCLRMVVTWNTDSFIVSNRLGAQEVVSYSVLVQIAAVLFGILNGLSTGYWTAYSEAAARQDWDWIRFAVRRVTLFGCSMASATAVCFYFWGPSFYALWVPQVEISRPALLLLAAYLPVVIFIEAHCILLNALSCLKEQVLPALVISAFHVAVSLYLIPEYGVAGAAAATLVPDLLIGLVVYPWLVRHKTQGQVVAPGFRLGGVLALPLLAASLAAWLVRPFLLAWGPVASLVVGPILTLAVYAATLLPLLGEDAAALRKLGGLFSGRPRT